MSTENLQDCTTKLHSTTPLGRERGLTLSARFSAHFSQTHFAALLDRIRRPRVILPLYLICSLLVGSIFILTHTVGETTDTWTHFYRIDAFLNGQLIATPVDSLSPIYGVPGASYGGPVDWDIIALSTTSVDPTSVVKLETITSSSTEHADVPFNGAAIYSPLSYPPYLLGLLTAKVAGLDALSQYYVMLFFGLAFYCVLSAAALLIVPRFRLLTALFFLCPWSIMRISSLSADGVTLVYIAFFSCLLYRSYVFRPTRPLLAALMIFGFLVAFSKLAYAPLLFAPLALLFVHRRLKGKAIIIAGVLISTILLLAWTSLAGDFSTNPTMVSTAEVAERTAAILSNPLPLIQEITLSIVTLQGYAEAFDIGHAPVSLIVYLGIVIALISTTIQAAKKRLEGKRAAFWYACIFLVATSIALVFTALYLQYDPAGTPGIIGVQPRRYFWPLVLLLVFVIGEGRYVKNSTKVTPSRTDGQSKT